METLSKHVTLSQIQELGRCTVVTIMTKALLHDSSQLSHSSFHRSNISYQCDAYPTADIPLIRLSQSIAFVPERHNVGCNRNAPCDKIPYLLQVHNNDTCTLCWKLFSSPQWGSHSEPAYKWELLLCTQVQSTYCIPRSRKFFVRIPLDVVFWSHVLWVKDNGLHDVSCVRQPRKDAKPGFAHPIVH